MFAQDDAAVRLHRAESCAHFFNDAHQIALICNGNFYGAIRTPGRQRIAENMRHGGNLAYEVRCSRAGGKTQIDECEKPTPERFRADIDAEAVILTASLITMQVTLMC